MGTPTVRPYKYSAPTFSTPPAVWPDDKLNRLVDAARELLRDHSDALPAAELRELRARYDALRREQDAR